MRRAHRVGSPFTLAPVLVLLLTPRAAVGQQSGMAVRREEALTGRIEAVSVVSEGACLRELWLRTTGDVDGRKPHPILRLCVDEETRIEGEIPRGGAPDVTGESLRPGLLVRAWISRYLLACEPPQAAARRLLVLPFGAAPGDPR